VDVAPDPKEQVEHVSQLLWSSASLNVLPLVQDSQTVLLEAVQVDVDPVPVEHVEQVSQLL
jgi:hypothetical protein